MESLAFRAELPPAYQPSRRYISTFTESQTATHRRMARFCRDQDDGRLSRRERSFVWRIGSCRELTIARADWLSAITDRIEYEDRSA